MEVNQPYISSGTWSLLGVKTPKPITDRASEEANYSNEGGVGYNRYQKNIMGMWLVNELRRDICPELPFPEIVKTAEESTCGILVDANAQEFLAPKSMKAAFDKAADGKLHTVGDYFRCAYRSLAVSYQKAIVISVFVSTLSAYGFACIRFPGCDKLFAVYLFTLMMPGFLNIIPQFLVLKQLTLPGLPNGLIGTRAGLILIYVATNVCGHTFFLRNFFRSLPSSLAESVLLDGGGHKDIFFRVMLPLSAPAVGTMTIFAFQGFWEEYFTAKVLVGANEKMITFPLLLQRLNGQYATRWEWVFAASIMALIPVIVLFVVFQRKTVVGGLTQGAVKG